MAIMRSATASFDGKFALNFYLLLPDEILNDSGAYVLFTGGEKPVKVMVSEAKIREVSGETRYGFPYPVVAKEIRDNINLKLYDGNDQVVTLKNLAGTNDYTETGVNYSLYTYASRMLDSSTSSQKMKALSAATIDYCTAAQIYFNYKAEGLSVSSVVPAVTLDQLAEYADVFEGELPEGVTRRSLSALFEDDNSLRLYFVYADGHSPEDYSYQNDGAHASIRVKHSSSGDTYYLEVSSVLSNRLGLVHELTITGSKSYTVKASVLTYARSSVLNGSEARQNLGKALYLYYLAAVDYFG
jgi:hypothetical protein